MNVEEFNERVQAIIKANENIEEKDPKELTYLERHAVRHLRNLRDQEYAKLAYKACGDYCKAYTECYDREGFMAPFRCQDVLEDMKICINRYIIRLRESAPDITTVQTEPLQFVPYDQNEEQLKAFKSKVGLK